MVDDPSMPMAKSPVDDGTPWPWLMGTAFPFMAFVLLVAGHGAIDQPEPRVGQAILWYLLAAGVGVWALVLVIQRYNDHMRMVGLTGGVVGLALGAFTAFALQDSYGDWGGIGVMLVLVYFVLPVLLIGFIVTLIVLMGRHGREGAAQTFLMWGFTGTTTAMVAAMYHMLTINMQAGLAREAHQAPGWTVVAAVVVLAMGAWFSRRSRC